MDARIRPAKPADIEDVIGFTHDTWADRETGDYLPDLFPRWVETDDPARHTLVADVDGRAVGTLQTVRLSASEAWLHDDCSHCLPVIATPGDGDHRLRDENSHYQGLRVHPDHRGEGIGTGLVHAGFSWASEQGATVARAMVFSWNEMGLGLARAAGFEPATEFRWAHPVPDVDAAPETNVREDPETVWAYWRESDACARLAGLGLDVSESWALSTVTREQLRDALPTSLLVIGDDEPRGVTHRTRTHDREDGEESHRWAEYGVAAWADADACEMLMAAIARDAAAVDADRTRVLIPETTRAVSDVALAGHRVSESPDFVLRADLSESL